MKHASTNRLSRSCAASAFGSALCVVMLGWPLAGCATDVNARRSIGGVRELPAIHDADGHDAEHVASSTMSSVATTRLDRGDWPPMEFRVPVDGTVHAPLLKSSTRFNDDIRRAHGLFPTADSALTLSSDRWDETKLAIVEPGRVFLDLLLLPIRAVLDPAWEKTQGPSMYKRWHSGEYLAGPMPQSNAAGDEDS